MFERFTDRSRRVIVLAQEEARLLNHNYIGTEHLLLGLLAETDGDAARALESLGITLDAARDQVREMIGEGSEPQRGHIPFTPRAKKVLELSLREALTLRSQSIGSVHLLLGLIAEGEGVGSQIIERLGVSLPAVKERAVELSGNEPDPASGTAEPRATAIAARSLRMLPEERSRLFGLLTDINFRLARIEAHLGISADAGEEEPPAEGEAGAEPAESAGGEPDAPDAPSAPAASG